MSRRTKNEEQESPPSQAGLLVDEVLRPGHIPETPMSDARILDEVMGCVEVVKKFRNHPLDGMQERWLHSFCDGFLTCLDYVDGKITPTQLRDQVLLKMNLLGDWKKLEEMGIQVDMEKFAGWWEKQQVRRSAPSSYLGPTSLTLSTPPSQPEGDK